MVMSTFFSIVSLSKNFSYSFLFFLSCTRTGTLSLLPLLGLKLDLLLFSQ